jgi:O-antigen ligase
VSLIAALSLVFVLIVRPQEVWDLLAQIHLLDALTLIAAVSLTADLLNRKVRHPYSPQLPFVVGFLLYCYFSTSLIIGPVVGIGRVTTGVFIPVVFMIVVMYAGRTFDRLRAIILLLLVLAGFVTSIAVHQGLTTPVCMELRLDEEGSVSPDVETVSGECESVGQCFQDNGQNAEYACERLGLFGTMSTGRRVRYRGQLGDPNELSVFIGAVIPLLFAIGIKKEQKLLSAFVLAMVGLGLYAVILSQSRGGQLVVGAVFGFYFISRFGKKGLILGLLFALPVLMFGGRDDAEGSSDERLRLLYEAMSLIGQHPILGVGKDRFPDMTDLHLTAHNSYVLAAAEAGLPGFFLWSGLFWSSFKIPLTLVRAPPKLMNPRLAPVATAMLVSFIGMAVGIFFLSFTFKQLLFVWFGMAAALYQIVQDDDPTFRVTMGRKDLLGIVAADVTLLVAVYVYTRLKGGG